MAEHLPCVSYETAVTLRDAGLSMPPKPPFFAWTWRQPKREPEPRWCLMWLTVAYNRDWVKEQLYAPTATELLTWLADRNQLDTVLPEGPPEPGGTVWQVKYLVHPVDWWEQDVSYSQHPSLAESAAQAVLAILRGECAGIC